MKRIIAVLDAISINPVVNPDIAIEDNNVVVGHYIGRLEEERTELKVVRSYTKDDNGLPSQEISVFVRGVKVYGYSSEFLSKQELIEFNRAFYVVQVKIDKIRADRQVEARNFFNAKFPEIK